jgi:lipoate-protein ligase A
MCRIYKKRLKVKGGKLVSVKIEEKNEKIYNITITGDFFLHPEETIFTIEQRLQGTPVNLSKEELTRIIADAAVDSRFIGITIEDIALAILEAIGS